MLKCKCFPEGVKKTLLESIGGRISAKRLYEQENKNYETELEALQLLEKAIREVPVC